MRLSVSAFVAQFCFLVAYPASWTSYQPLFLPGPQFCPDTGRTVCTAVDYYPTEQIFHLLTNTRAQVFNLTSLFVDERKGDVEPNLSQLPTPQPNYQDGGYQLPPGGRFSPAGQNWNSPPASVNNKPTSGGLQQQDRWRQIGGGQQRQPNNGRQSRAQDMTNRSPTDPSRSQSVTQRFNYNDRTSTEYGPYAPGGQQQNQQSYDSGQYGMGNFTTYYPQPPDPYQIQPPQTQYGVKGQNPYPGITMRPKAQVSNWKGSSNYADKYLEPGAPQQVSRFGSNRRERRNEDVEVACQVRSTYVPPRAALSDNSEWKYIINVPERDRRFTQVVRVDICLNPGDPCSSRLSLPFGFESRCRQKYIKKKLLSLNPDGQGTSEDNFFIPSCCVCEIVRPNKK